MSWSKSTSRGTTYWWRIAKSTARCWRGTFDLMQRGDWTGRAGHQSWKFDGAVQGNEEGSERIKDSSWVVIKTSCFFNFKDKPIQIYFYCSGLIIPNFKKKYPSTFPSICRISDDPDSFSFWLGIVIDVCVHWERLIKKTHQDMNINITNIDSFFNPSIIKPAIQMKGKWTIFIVTWKKWLPYFMALNHSATIDSKNDWQTFQYSQYH